MKEMKLIQTLLNHTSAFVRERYAHRGEVAVTSKSNPNDLLTEVDLAVQDKIVEAVAKHFPTDVIAAEERNLANAPDDPNARCWVIDPIDGTQNFVRGLFPIFGISIAFARGGRAEASGVALPITGDLFTAERGVGAFMNGKRLQVSQVPSVSLGRIEVDFSGPQERASTLRCASRLMLEAGQIRCACATVVALCQVASGEMDGFVHVGLNPWDYAAAQLVVEEAGGTATRFNGSPLEIFDEGQGAILTNGLIHKEVLSLVEPL